MKKLLIAILAASVLAVGAQSGNDLFQKALLMERTEGNLPEAIKLYKRIVDKSAGDRKLAARALMQMGQCYEKLGQADARKTYERLVQNYADQTDLAADARQRLASLGQLSSMPHPVGLTFRKVWAGRQGETPGVSPDGKYLALTTVDTGDIVVQNLVTGERRQVTHEGDPSKQGADEALISPDGKLIAYLLEVWGGSSHPDQSHLELRLMGFDGSHDRTLCTKNSGYIEPYGFSPDSKQILVVISEDYDRSSLMPAQIGWVAIADGSLRIIKTLPRRTQVGSLFRWPSLSASPDGRWIVYSMLPNEDSEERDLFLMSADGSRDAPLMQHPADDRHPVWSPDGSRVLFVSDRAGTTGIWSIPIAEGKAAGPRKF